jgi:peroxiredoxin
MKKKFLLLLVTLILPISLAQPVLAAECVTPPEGGVLPEIKLPVPQDAAERDYLGVDGKGSFKISRIKAGTVIIEIFSMYCPYCQKEAPLVNELYQLINNRRDLKDKIKMIGIGAGNTPFEVEIFKKEYKVQFPLFSDESFTIHKSLGQVRTPYFFVIKLNADGSHKILYSKGGTIQDPNQFLGLILKRSGLKQEG